MKSILPSNSTRFERAMELSAASRLAGIPVARLAALFDPKTCPAGVLPWLAWSFGVEEWRDGMTEAEQRAAIAAAIEIFKRRGTVGAVRSALAALGYSARIIEHRGTFTFDVETEFGAGVMAQDYDAALRVIRSAKNVRSHLGKFAAVHGARPRLALRAVSHDAEILTLSGASPESAGTAESLEPIRAEGAPRKD